MATRPLILLVCVLNFLMAVSALPIGQDRASLHPRPAADDDAQKHGLLSNASRVLATPNDGVTEGSWNSKPTRESCFCAGASMCCYSGGLVDCTFGLCGLGA